MPASPELDFDVILHRLLDDLSQSVRDWKRGAGREEVALLNRITERLSRRRRNCDVGRDYPVRMRATFHELHRAGEESQDHLGSDFAVTINVPEAQLTKTAFFQLKISRKQRLTLFSEQLEQAAVLPAVMERAFVFAIDDSRRSYRMASVRQCKHQMPPGQQTKLFDTSTWDSVSDWVRDWFHCKQGPPTSPGDPHPVEALLQAYELGEEPDLFLGTADTDIPDKWYPAQAWIQYRFEKRE